MAAARYGGRNGAVCTLRRSARARSRPWPRTTPLRSPSVGASEALPTRAPAPFKFPKWETFLRARAHHVAEVRADVAAGHCLLAEIHDDEVSTEVPPDLRGDPDGACAVVSGRDGDAGLENLAGHAVLRLVIRVEQDTEPRAVPVVQDLGAGVL